ncbi:MAG: OadG family protein [Lachnospiraceae bacterium]|nr:OadG family protein [Lachnospiraceae bacterium]
MNMMVLAKVSVGDALLNVAIGMITVFIVLILISFIIGLFKYISVVQNKLADRKANKDSLANSADNVFSQIEEKEDVEEVYVDATDDLELVAVITAAIAASMGTSTDGFVVRSIRRASRSKWKNA